MEKLLPKQHFQVSALHYAFVVNAFVNLLIEENYELTARGVAVTTLLSVITMPIVSAITQI